jgi:hypothetical protein
MSFYHNDFLYLQRSDTGALLDGTVSVGLGESFETRPIELRGNYEYVVNISSDRLGQDNYTIYFHKSFDGVNWQYVNQPIECQVSSFDTDIKIKNPASFRFFKLSFSNSAVGTVVVPRIAFLEYRK